MEIRILHLAEGARQATGLTDALLDPLCQFVQMDMAGIIFVPGIDHADQRALLLLHRVAHAAHKAFSAFRSFTEFPVASHIRVCFLFHHAYLSKSSFMAGMVPEMDCPPSTVST